jgi:hypothetical protein
MNKLSPSKPGPSPIVGLRIPIELRQQLDVLAAVHGVERSELVRRLIAAAVCSPDMEKPASVASTAGSERSPERGFYGTNARL